MMGGPQAHDPLGVRAGMRRTTCDDDRPLLVRTVRPYVRAMNRGSVFVPKLFTTLRAYDRRQFSHDLSAGVIVGIVALPLAIAFGIASGVSPAQGIYTAIVAGFIISFLGGSRVQIGGPTGAFVVVVYTIVQRYGVAGLATATLMAGIILVLLGVFKMGAMMKFI